MKIVQRNVNTSTTVTSNSSCITYALGLLVGVTLGVRKSLLSTKTCVTELITITTHWAIDHHCT